MRACVLPVVASLWLVIAWESATFAGPPLIGSKSAQNADHWYDSLNPTTWSWPSMPWSKEPPRIQKKSPGMFASMKRSAQSGWTKTKKTLDPSRLMERREKPVVRPANTATESGFFSSLFGREENKEIRTVNDFLSQPQPR